MSERIGFVHYPHWPDHARLETMPFALQSVRALNRAGWPVDLFVWQSQTSALQEALGPGVWLREPGRLALSLPKRLQSYGHALRYGFARNYRCLFGLGQIGIFVASAMARVAHCPLVYLNDELPSGCPDTVWRRMERRAAQRADFIVTPDSCRNPQLLTELGLAQDTPACALYNVPVVDHPVPSIDWRRRLGIPHDRHYVVHAGSVADWAQVPEVLATVPYWPQDVVLVLHSRGGEAGDRYRRQLGHLGIEGRVFWSTEPLSEPALHSLLAASLASLGLYRNSGPNIDLIGYSSGKIMRSLACGTPVIASAIGSLDFVTQHALGVQVTHPAEIAGALPGLIAEREALRERCRRFIGTVVSFPSAWKSFTHRFGEVTGVDLDAPPQRRPASERGGM